MRTKKGPAIGAGLKNLYIIKKGVLLIILTVKHYQTVSEIFQLCNKKAHAFTIRFRNNDIS